MKKNIFLLSKDVLGKFYLPVYGNTFWKTPNLDELVRKGTVFYRHYTAAPSSAMAYFSMFTGLNPMDSKMKTYRILSPEERFSGDTLFDKATALGFECHIIWDAKWDTTAKLHSECYGRDTIFHSLEGIRQPTGVHAIEGRTVVDDPVKARQTCERIEQCVRSIAALEHPTFTWMHLPHVFNGRTGYGTDIDLFDWCVGMLRETFGDDCLYITADHGNMNGAHGKLGYGFDVYEEASAIPLITPRINGLERVDFPTSNIDLFSIIFEGVIPQREFVFSDSAYYAQLHRKLAIIHGRYKYIYSAQGKREELYDVIYDPHETVNLVHDCVKDPDRGIVLSLHEMYVYPNWDNIQRELEILRACRKNVWKKMSKQEYMCAIYEKIGKFIKRKINFYKKKLRIKVTNLIYSK